MLLKEKVYATESIRMLLEEAKQAIYDLEKTDFYKECLAQVYRYENRLRLFEDVAKIQAINQVHFDFIRAIDPSELALC